MQNSDDAAATSDNNTRYQADGCILSCDFTTPLTDGRADFVSFNSDGFTLSIPDAFPADWRISYICLGGADLTNQEIGTFTSATVTGNQEINLAGAFRPDLVILFGPHQVGAAPAGTASAGRWYLGAFTGTADEHVISQGADGGSATADTASYHKIGECIAVMPATVGASMTGRASLTSIDADGFTLNWLEVTGTAEVNFYIALKGGSFAVGDFVTLTSTGTITESGLAFQPKGALILSHCKVESTVDTGQADELMSIGAFDSSLNRNCQAHVDRLGPTAMEVATAINFDHVYAHIDETDGASAALVATADIATITSDGFTLDQDDADTVAALCSYIAFGDAPAAPTVTAAMLEVVGQGVGSGVMSGAR